jgi:hypothetical protein
MLDIDVHETRLIVLEIFFVAGTALSCATK